MEVLKKESSGWMGVRYSLLEVKMRIGWAAVMILWSGFVSCQPSAKKVGLSVSETKTYGGREHQFTELPGFFVEFVKLLESPGSEEPPQSPYCSGVYVGDGYILTAAHCMRKDGGRRGFNIITQEGKKKLIPFEDVESLVYHSGFVATEHNRNKKGLYDIALLKVSPTLGFADQAHLPTSEEYSSEKLEGEVWVYGIGRSVKRESDRVMSEQDHPRDYYGGLAYVDSRPRMSEAKLETSLNQLRKELENISPLDLKSALDKMMHKDVTYKDFSNEERELLGNYVQNQINKNKSNLSDDSQRLVGMLYTSIFYPFRGSTQEPKKDELFGEPFAREFICGASKCRIRYSGEAARGKVEEADRIISTCAGDSGGPVLKKQGSQFTLVAVNVASALRSAPISSIAESFHLQSDTGCYGDGGIAFGVSVWAHRAWIGAVKKAIAQGQHRLSLEGGTPKTVIDP